jgi:putative transposase
MDVAFGILCSVIRTWMRLCAGAPHRSLLAEVVALRAQLIVARRKISRARLSPIDRLILGFTYHFLSPRVRLKTLILVKPQTVLKFHRWLVNKKSSRLYRNFQRKSGRPPLSKEIKTLILEIKQKNPLFGCPQIAAIILDRTGTSVSEETVRRTLMKFYTGQPGSGPSWLSFLATQTHSLWSLDFFQVESICLKTHWVLVIMDQWSRRIIGFAVSSQPANSTGLVEMFTSCISDLSPKRISHDHDPLFRSVDWKRMISVLEIEEIWSVAFIPRSHPFVERLIGTIRRELLDRTLFWNERDLLKKLSAYQTYFNEARVHSAIDGKTPDNRDFLTKIAHEPRDLKWKSYCKGLFNVPVAA